VHLNKLEREENLLSAFSYFDKDGSGYITIDEIQAACKEFGLDDIHIDEIVKEIDQDNVSKFFFLLLLRAFLYRS
jgi:calcium-dependent protein kinase